ncbi:hypothetical protein OY671_007689, partial [Metschnikowia pulcherrima]
STPALAKNCGSRTSGPMTRSASQGVAISSGPSWRAARCQASTSSNTPATLQAREVRRTGAFRRDEEGPLMGFDLGPRLARAAASQARSADGGFERGSRHVRQMLSHQRRAFGRVIHAPARRGRIGRVDRSAQRRVVGHADGGHDARSRQGRSRGKRGAPGSLQAGAAMQRGRAGSSKAVRQPDGVLSGQFGASSGESGRALQHDARSQSSVNRFARRTLVGVATRYGGQIVRSVSETVRRWDARTVTDRIEGAVGRDLQFIRINGTSVGGSVGVSIHAVDVSL